MTNTKLYEPSIDILRILAILGVIVIHTTTVTLQASNNNLNDFSFSLFLNQTARFAVPLFFIISGYALSLNYNSKSGYLHYLQSRLEKIIIPYIFWSFIYYFFIFKTTHTDFFTSLLKGESAYHLYFIPSLIIFYLLFPIIYKIFRLISHPLIMLYLLSLQILILGSDYYVKPFALNLPIKIFLLNYFIFMFGIYLAKNKDLIKNRISKFENLLLPGSILLALYIFTEGKERYFQTQNYWAFYSQWRPSVLVYTISLAVFLFFYLGRKNLPEALIKQTSSLILFVYFVHVAILTYLWELPFASIYNALSNTASGRILFDLLLFVCVATISFTLAFLIRKVPKLVIITG